jgi:N-acetylglutamate synthase-like GNAT family acetyltransferase
MSVEVKIRTIVSKDSYELYNLRNSSESVRWFLSNKKIAPNEHKIWVESRLAELSNFTLVALVKDNVIGVCYLNFLKKNDYEISININCNFQNIGVGKRLIQEMLVAARKSKIQNIYAVVHRKNINSINFFNKNFFILCEDADCLLPEHDRFIKMKLQLEYLK